MILRIRRLAGFALLGACAVAHAQAPAATPDCGPKITAAECAQAAAQMQASSVELARQVLPLIESLSRTGDVDSLLAAASFAEIADGGPELFSGPSVLPPALTRDALLARAVVLAPDDAAVWFAVAAESCASRPGDCPADAARERLRELDADNAAVWIREVDRLSAAGARYAARAALPRAARAST
jgi:hypothetical protein